MASDHIRASDYDRDAVVATLRDAFSEGRLTLDEFQDRTTAAYACRTWGDLRELTTDLPVQPPLGADLPAGAHPDANAVPPGPDAHSHGAPQFPGVSQWPGAPQLPVEPQFPGVQPVAGSQPNGLPPHLGQPANGKMPPSTRPRGGLGPVFPIVGMWILFSLATRSAGGAVVFLIAVVMIVTIALATRRRR